MSYFTSDFTSLGMGSVGMEERHYPTVFTSPSRYACVILWAGLATTARVHACILSFQALYGLPLYFVAALHSNHGQLESDSSKKL